MSVLRNRPKGVRSASFGLGLCVFALSPNEIGYQDIASLLARQPGVTERWQTRVFAPAVSSIQVATFSFARPIGTNSRNAALNLVNFRSDGDSRQLRNPMLQSPSRYVATDFPTVDRTVKGDRLALANPEPVIAPEAPEAERPGAEPQPDDLSPGTAHPALATPAKAADAATEPGAALDPELAAALDAPPLEQYDAANGENGASLHDTSAPPVIRGVATVPPTVRDPFTFKTANLFFGSASLGSSLEAMQSWQPGEAPVIVTPGPTMDPDFKSAAAASHAPGSGGQTIAGKGVVNDGKSRIKTPAERLGLFDPKAREKQEKCLANAVYFEARGEAVRGQMAVAQVVMNRVFSGFYPTTVCGVVYQNAHRRLACQFTFACDGIPDVVREPDMWERARKIAKATLDGRLWLPEVGKSTHYHAYWVRPSWVHEMRKMYRTGVHTFYRPRNWGDGSDAPSWGTVAQTAEITAKLAAVKP